MVVDNLIGSAVLGKMSFWDLVATAFFAVAGGPWAIEQLVHVAGPFWTIAGLLTVPWIWSLPLALMTAELASCTPGMGGAISWAEKGLGPYYAYSVGTWMNIAVLFDNAIYPVIFLDAAEEAAKTFLGLEPFSLFTRWLLGNIFIWAITYVNLKGITAVSQSNVALFSTVLGPFIVMALLAFFTTPASEYIHVFDVVPEVQFGAFFTALLWNTCGYDSCGPLAGDVHNPARTYPRAMLVVVGIVTLVYTLPVVVGAATDSNYEQWHTGYWVVLAERIGGPLLSGAISFSAVTCSIGLYMSLLAVGARQLCCQAQLGLAPQWLGRLSANNVPVASTLFYSAASSLLIMLPFSSLVEKSAVISVLLCFIQFASLIALRRTTDIRAPDTFRIPLSTTGIILFSVVPCTLVSSTLFFCTASTWVVGIAMIVLTHLAWSMLSLKDSYRPTSSLAGSLDL